jgi:hypothetical protein
VYPPETNPTECIPAFEKGKVPERDDPKTDVWPGLFVPGEFAGKL